MLHAAFSLAAPGSLKIDMPAVSVVLPVYNGELFLAEAIESVLSQTWRDFELIIVDDGSKDQTPEIIRHYQSIDNRIITHTFQENQGLINALNQGCQNAHGDFIAIMHSDDICLPARLDAQVKFMRKYPDVGVLGSAALAINEAGQAGWIMTVPTLPGLVPWLQYFGNHIIHPTTMIRHSSLKAVQYYDPDAFLIDDYDLWLRIGTVCKITNLSAVLLKYRLWSGHASAVHRHSVERCATTVVQRGVSGLIGRDISQETASYLRRVHDSHAGEKPFNLTDILDLAGLICEMHQKYVRSAESLLLQERLLIANDAAFKLIVLATYAIHYSPRDATRLIAKAVLLSPLVWLRVMYSLFRKLLSGPPILKRVRSNTCF